MALTKIPAHLSSTPSISDSGSSTAITIDSSGNVAIAGNLSVTGSTTTADNLVSADKNITLNYHASNDTSGSADGAGITIQDAVNSSTDATLLWDASSDIFKMSHGLQIPKNLHIKNTASEDTAIILENTNNAQNLNIDYYNNAGSVQSRINYAEGPAAWNFIPNTSNGNSALYINYSGNVGVGTTSLKSTLHIKPGGNDWEDGILLQHDNANTGWNIHPERTRSSLWFGYNSDTSVGETSQAATGILYLMSSGKVGIGTNNPSGKLDVHTVDTSAYSSTGEPVETALIHNESGDDGTGATYYSSLGMTVGSGATSQGFINYVRTADNQGKFTFSQRTGSSSYAESMVIDSSGKVGIGTTTLNKFFNLADPDNGGEENKLHFEASGVTHWSIYPYDRTNNHYPSLYLGNNANLKVLNTGAVQIGNASAGVLVHANPADNKVGIGTTSPAAKLHINTSTNSPMLVESTHGDGGYIELQLSDSGGAGSLTGYIGDSQALVSSGDAGDLAIRAQADFVVSTGGSSERFKIDSSGNSTFTGGNTTNLNVFADSGANIGQVNITALTDGSSAAHSIAEIRMQQPTGDQTSRKGEILFRVSDNGGPATAMTLENNLNIKIPGSLFVDTTTDNSVSNDEGVVVSKDGTVVIRRGSTMLYMHHTAGSGTGTLVAINKAQSTVGTITATNSNAAYNTSSDYRLKENVDYDWDATTRLKQLKPARFNWIADSTNTLQDGFMAHEVEDIVPEAVTGTKDAVWSAEEEANGEGIEGQIKGQQMDHSKLVPLLVKTVQELEARIKVLEG